MTGSEHVKAGDEAIDQPLVLVASPGVRGASSAIDSGFFIEGFFIEVFIVSGSRGRTPSTFVPSHQRSRFF
jgi:hypothetical protein